MDDDALLARFAALKAPVKPPQATPPDARTSVSLEDQAKAAAEDDAELERIANAPATSSGARDDDLSALLANLASGNDLSRTGDLGDDTGDSASAFPRSSELQKQADALLKEVDEANLLISAGSKATDGTGDQAADIYPGEDDTEETEEQILERALAEASLEGTADVDVEEEGPAVGSEPPRVEAGAKSESKPTASILKDLDQHSPELSFPQLPSTSALPVPTFVDEDEADPEDQAKIDALMSLQGPSQFPSVPTNKPLNKGELGPAPRAPGQGWNLPGFNDARDEDLDSWCSELRKRLSSCAIVDPRHLQQGRRSQVPRLRGRPVLPRVLDRGSWHWSWSGERSQGGQVYVEAVTTG